MFKISEELLHLHPTYKVTSERDGDSESTLAVIKKRFTVREKFAINSELGEYVLEALDIPARSFTLTKNGRTVAIVSRKYFSLAEAYGVEIDGDEDHAFIIALVIITNEALHYY